MENRMFYVIPGIAVDTGVKAGHARLKKLAHNPHGADLPIHLLRWSELSPTEQDMARSLEAVPESERDSPTHYSLIRASQSGRNGTAGLCGAHDIHRSV